MKRTLTKRTRVSALLIPAALLGLALAFSGCPNPAEPDTKTETFRNLAFVSDEPVVNTESAQKGERAGVFTTEGGTGTAAFSFEENRNGEYLDNDRFLIAGNELIINTPRAGGLEAKAYKIRVKATDGAGTVLSPGEPFTFQVYGDMAAPGDIAVIAGQRRLYISWTRSRGAKTYEYCIGTEAGFSAPTGSTGIFTVSSGTETEGESFGGNRLLDATRYYVRVRGKSGALTSPWSAVVPADTVTGDPIQAFWYTGSWEHLKQYDEHTGPQSQNPGAYPAYADYRYTGSTVNGVTYPGSERTGEMGWDSSLDRYRYRALPGTAGVELIYGGPFAAGSVIVYHKRFTREEAQAAGRFRWPASQASSTADANDAWHRAFYRVRDENKPYLLPNGNPAHAGVFVTRQSNGTYYCNYYWALGAVQYEEEMDGQYNYTLPPGDINLKAHMALGGAIGVSNPSAAYTAAVNAVTVRLGQGASLYSSTVAHAKKNYSLDYMYIHTHWFPSSWYRKIAELTGNGSSYSYTNPANGWLPRDFVWPGN